MASDAPVPEDISAPEEVERLVKRRKVESKSFPDPLARGRGRLPFLIIDGGLATHIEALGEDIDHPLWSARCLVKNQEVIRKAHADFFGAGADVAITASYQAHFDGFRDLGLDDEAALKAMRDSVALARKAAPPGGIVAGSVGSYGASLHNGAEYTGEYPGMDEDKLVHWHRPRAAALVEAGCDVLACETIPSLMEARALARLVEEVKHPAWVTFSCKSETQAASGDDFAECVNAVANCTYVVGVGVNCTDPNFVSSLVGIARETLPPEKHVVVYPNKGEVWCGLTHTWVSGTATADDHFVSMALEWAKRGASCIGGCCRTTPATIAALRAGLATAARREQRVAEPSKPAVQFEEEVPLEPNPNEA